MLDLRDGVMEMPLRFWRACNVPFQSPSVAQMDIFIMSSVKKLV